MQIVVTIGDDDDSPVTVEVCDDSTYTPEVVEALWMYGQLHGSSTS